MNNNIFSRFILAVSKGLRAFWFVLTKRGKKKGKLCWWNNGHENKLARVCPGREWYKGMLGSGSKWWNDGINNRLAVECPGPGWTRGMLSTGTWWNNGIVNTISKTCPGSNWKPGMIQNA